MGIRKNLPSPDRNPLAKNNQTKSASFIQPNRIYRKNVAPPEIGKKGNCIELSFLIKGGLINYNTFSINVFGMLLAM